MKKIQNSSSSKTIAQRLDGWINILTGLGRQSKDKRTGARVELDFLDQVTIEALYQTDDIAAKIIDRPVKEILRKGFCLKIKDDVDGLGVLVLERTEAFDLNKKLETALQQARLYGGAGLIIGIKGDDPAKVLDLTKINEIEYLTVIDRFRLRSASSIQMDATKPNFGYPEFYRVSAQAEGSLGVIHHSRVIRFDGVELPYNLRAQNDYWGDSVFCRIYNVLRNFNGAHDSASVLLHDFSQAVFKMKNLAEMIAQGDDELVMKRLSLVATTASVVNAIVVQDDEEYERKSTSVAGLPDLLKMINSRLVAATDLPHTLLLGESPSGLGASGESETKDWYDYIASEQKSRLKPQLTKILDIFFAEKSGPSKGKSPEKYEIKFHPLREMDEKQTVELRKTQAETDAIYIGQGVLDPEEVTQARFGTGEYSIETQIDMESRNSFESKSNAGQDYGQGGSDHGDPVQS